MSKITNRINKNEYGNLIMRGIGDSNSSIQNFILKELLDEQDTRSQNYIQKIQSYIVVGDNFSNDNQSLLILSQKDQSGNKTNSFITNNSDGDLKIVSHKSFEISSQQSDSDQIFRLNFKDFWLEHDDQRIMLGEQYEDVILKRFISSYTDNITQVTGIENDITSQIHSNSSVYIDKNLHVNNDTMLGHDVDNRTDIHGHVNLINSDKDHQLNFGSYIYDVNHNNKPDTNLYRDSQNVLKTDSNFTVGSSEFIINENRLNNIDDDTYSKLTMNQKNNLGSPTTYTKTVFQDGQVEEISQKDYTRKIGQVTVQKQNTQDSNIRTPNVHLHQNSQTDSNLFLYSESQTRNTQITQHQNGDLSITVNDPQTNDIYFNQQEQRFSKDVIIENNLFVKGTTTEINVDTLEVEDNMIVLNSNYIGETVTPISQGVLFSRGDNNKQQLFQHKEEGQNTGFKLKNQNWEQTGTPDQVVDNFTNEEWQRLELGFMQTHDDVNVGTPTDRKDLNVSNDINIHEDFQIRFNEGTTRSVSFLFQV